MSEPQSTDNSIAIIGMAGRFPKARNLDEFWRNLCAGVEGITFFTDDELEARPLAGSENGASHVKASGMLDDAALFDAEFFGLTPREAEIMDPQQRIFLECAWEALEHAGCQPEKYSGSIGVFGGMSMNTYFANNLVPRPDVMAQAGDYQVMLGNDKDFLTTRVSYKLNLKGPSLNIQTACSTSLVAVCVACQHLLNGQCDAALAGGVSISFPQKKAYVAQAGGIGSPDGHCRPFDAHAAGTVRGEGVGIVVLKRLEDAVANGDQVFAVIKGFATNNDGANKIGYTAPSVEGQAEVIAAAHAVAGISPDSISYLEAHGTATPLGDPIEIAGLTKAFHSHAGADKTCALGSVKSNIGHLDTAAGIAGLIKTALALYHKKIPATLNFQSPNPKIDFTSNPFFVNTALTDWPHGAGPRRAGVSSFGIGGTNAHIVLEESPVSVPASRSRPAQLVTLSARTPAALDQATANLCGHLEQHPDVNLADVAATLQLGRHSFATRRMLVCNNIQEAVGALKTLDARQVVTRVCPRENPLVTFMFPGQGAQSPDMGRELYTQEPVFREQVDLCAGLLEPELGFDLRTVLYPEPAELEAAALRLRQTALAQPALFVVEYALARLWMSWGIKPESLIGHSLGEYVAACLARVFSLEDALKLVAARGRLMQSMPAGTMLAVRLPEQDVRPLLNGELSLAGVNAPSLCVASGPTAAIERLQGQLQSRGVGSVPLNTSHAFHSAMMEPMLAAFTALVAGVERKSPQIPFISNVTGTWITAAQAVDPGYWTGHLRQTVRFADGAAELLKGEKRIFLEVGPGHTLTGLVKQAGGPRTDVFASLPEAPAAKSAQEGMLRALGYLWLAGATVDWPGYCQNEYRRRVALPSYPFERKRHFVDPVAPQHSRTNTSANDQVAESTGSLNGAPVETGTVEERTHRELMALVTDLSGLNLAGIPGETTFAELGFDSLFLTQVSLAIEKRFGVQIAFRQLLEELANLDALAAHLCENRRTHGSLAANASAVPPAAVSIPRQMPLTEAQRDLWFALQVSDAASCVYNECRLLHLRGPLNVGALLNSVQRIVQRHEALRTTISARGDFQTVQPSLTLEVPFADWSGREESERAGLWDAAQSADARQTFDLVNGPLVRARLFRFEDQHHALLFTVHHIICDGHSLGTILHELGEFYSAACRGERCELPPATQLTQYVGKEALPVSDREADEDYWLRQFSEFVPGADLPTDADAAGWTFEGARASRYLPARFVHELKSLCARQGCTLFTLLLGGYVMLMRRLTGNEEIVVGIPAADRTREGDDTLVGHCVHFIPVRVDISEDQPFTDYLVALQRAFWQAYEHRNYPFGALVQKLSLPRERGRTPLAPTTFNFERAGDRLKYHDVTATVATNVHGFTSFDLNFNAADIHGALQLDCRFNTSRFSPSAVRRWLAHFQTLLEAAVANPGRLVSDLPILSAVERQKVLLEWNTTKAALPTDRLIHKLFEEQVRRTPDAVAVVHGTARLTYVEIERRAERLAAYLKSLPLKAGVPVAVLLGRTPDMVASVLAVLKAGSAYLPLSPDDTAEQLASLVKESGATVIVTQRSLTALHTNSLPGCSWVFIDATLPSGPELSRGAEQTAASLACIIPGSGPDASLVAIEHRNVVNLVGWAQREFSREETAGVFYSAPAGSSLAILEIFLPLLSGGKVIVAENVFELAITPASAGVTLVNTTPALAAELERRQAIPQTLRALNLAGAPVKAPAVTYKIRQLYISPETTGCAICSVPAADGQAGGRPIANARVYILDARGQPLPPGVTGELYIAGAGVARGYLNQPALTAARFIADPFEPATGSRLFRTGEQACWRPDGTIKLAAREVVDEVPAGDLLEVLPRATDGSIDGATPAKREEATGPGVYATPGTDTEQALAEIWCSVLRVGAVGVQDDFFELGGHSLLIMQVLSRIREVFEVELSIHQFFETPTIAGLATAIEALGNGQPADGTAASVLSSNHTS